ncbi:hypothetical protein A2881_00485 [Candidatus Peribacteria bacterium RIFCSPHIGHO2_01_FULL_55_13]|nr:MAG: hypothetical protein A2881_00485 [Candidatus Peribacteria bacterium RIFCSPHIGHO2_01_FULL_55_13]
MKLNETGDKVDPKLVALCERALKGDNDACRELEQFALDGDDDALSLLKIANSPSEGSFLHTDFCVRNLEMIRDLHERCGLKL